MGSISAVRFFMVVSITISAATAERNCAQVASVSVKPPSDEKSGSEALSSIEPAAVVSARGKSTGREPMIMGSSEMPSTPVSTEVGQSGPPTRMQTLPSVSGRGSLRMRRMVRMVVELTPTIERTETFAPSTPPIAFCCMAMASSLVRKAKVEAYATPIQK